MTEMLIGGGAGCVLVLAIWWGVERASRRHQARKIAALREKHARRREARARHSANSSRESGQETEG